MCATVCNLHQFKCNKIRKSSELLCLNYICWILSKFTAYAFGCCWMTYYSVDLFKLLAVMKERKKSVYSKSFKLYFQNKEKESVKYTVNQSDNVSN